jgi:hypothetical protein
MHRCQMRANAIRHHHDEAAVIQIQPVAAANKLIIGVASKRAIWFGAKVGLIKAGHRASTKI